MNALDRLKTAQRLGLAFLLGAATASACAAALWFAWGQPAVRVGAAKQCTAADVDAVDLAGSCVAFWFGAVAPERVDDLRRTCGNPRNRRRRADEGVP